MKEWSMLRKLLFLKIILDTQKKNNQKEEKQAETENTEGNNAES